MIRRYQKNASQWDLKEILIIFLEFYHKESVLTTFIQNQTNITNKK